MTDATLPSTFNTLSQAIQSLHQELSAQVNKAINVSLTLRNWLIGFYIVEYEQSGADYALEKFSHENIGQLNTYVSWYRKNMMSHGDKHR